MEMLDTINHSSLGKGGTLWTNADNAERAAYEDALRRYQGPVQVVLCDEAYANFAFDPDRLDDPQDLQIDPGAFSVHVLNWKDLTEFDTYQFGLHVRRVRKEHLTGCR